MSPSPRPCARARAVVVVGRFGLMVCATVGGSEGHEDAPLGIVVEESSSEEGITRGETCVVRIVQAGNQHVCFFFPFQTG